MQTIRSKQGPTFDQRWRSWRLTWLMAIAIQAHAAPQLVDVQVLAPAGAREATQVVLRLSESADPVRWFPLQGGRALVLDLPGVASAVGRHVLAPPDSLAQRVTVAANRQQTRVVLHQRESADFRVEQSATAIRVHLSRVESTAVSPAASSPRDMPGPIEHASQARDLETTSKPSVAPSASVAPPSPLTPEAPSTREPGAQPKLQAHVAAVVPPAARAPGTPEPQPPVSALSLEEAKALLARVKAEAGARLAPDVLDKPSGQMSPPLALALERGASAPAPAPAPVARTLAAPREVAPAVAPRHLPPASSEVAAQSRANQEEERLISLQFQSIDIRSVLQAIADFSGFNVVASDGVKGELTVQLKEVPWREALQVILDAKGLGMRERDHVIWVAPKADLLADQENELKVREASRQLAPLTSAVFRLNYAKANQVLAQIDASSNAGRDRAPDAAPKSGLQPLPPKTQTRAGSLLTSRGVAFTDVRTNQLFVTDTQVALDAVRAFIQAVDVPLRQVMIEAKIVEADDTFSRNLGVKLGVGNTSNVTLGPRIGIGPNYNAVSATGSTSVLPFVNLPASGIKGAEAATFAISLFGASASRFLNLEVSALEADGRGKIVSSPRIVTADQVKATIEQGTEYPYQTATSSGATAVEFRKANLKLEVSPQITPGGHIILEVDINKDSRGETTAAGIAINTKHVQTQVLVENGGTLVIGGILEEYERNEVDKVPGLGDLPIIGNVFKSTRRQTDKAEVVVFLTPRIVQQQESGITSDRTGRYARVGQINGCSDAGQASGTVACGQ